MDRAPADVYGLSEFSSAQKEPKERANKRRDGGNQKGRERDKERQRQKGRQ